MKNISKKLSIIFFFGFIIVFTIVSLVLPKEDFSETENRSLASFPKFSLERIFNRKYTNGIDAYTADHFAFRPSWITIKTELELMSGKKDTGGVFILKDRLLEKQEEPNMDKVDKSILAINKFAEANSIETFLMIVPTATGIYSDELPSNAPEYNQKEFIDSVYSKISDKVVMLDSYTALSANKEKYIYYRNDHHWTSLGAYIAYDSTIRKMGFTPVDLDKFSIEHASNLFKGTLYSKAVYNGITADTLDIYVNESGPKIISCEVYDGTDIKSYDSMYFREYLDKKDKYSTYMGENQPVVTITTDIKNGPKLLVIKDSYAHCYVPFLAQHYSKITMLDLRYVNTPINNLINIEEYNQTLILYNEDTFASEDNIVKINLNK